MLISFANLKISTGFIVPFYLLGCCFAQSSEVRPQPERGDIRITKSSILGKEFMLATANPIATKAGYDILVNGGNAIDAAVAIQMVLNVVEPQSSGIGGGAFVLYWDAKKKKLYSFDGRETAPAAVKRDYFLKKNGDKKTFWGVVQGGGSVGVPGTLRLMEFIHKRHGTMKWPELFQPAIKIAHNGFSISPRLADSIASAQKRGLGQFPAAAQYFFNKDNSPKLAGVKLQNRPLAKTFQLIAKEGADVFYKGSIARSIVSSVRTSKVNPGILSLNDLDSYQVKVRSPICVPYRQYQICGMGSPSSGGLTVGQIFGILENFDLQSIGPGLRATHLFIEASKLAYADRNLYMADKDYVVVPESGLIEKAYVSTRANLITDIASRKAEPGRPEGSKGLLRSLQMQNEKPGTTHFVIVDKYGNAVSITSTIEMGFGSRVMVGGFLLNNELTDFSFMPIREGRLIANRIEGGKRPRSSMAPTIIFKNKKPILLTGSPGGSRIISYVARTTAAILDWDMDPQLAISRGHVVNRNGVTELEENTEAIGLKIGLEALGHKVKIRNLNSGLHAIKILKDGGLIGAADPRREGLVMGR